MQNISNTICSSKFQNSALFIQAEQEQNAKMHQKGEKGACPFLTLLILSHPASFSTQFDSSLLQS